MKPLLLLLPLAAMAEFPPFQPTGTNQTALLLYDRTEDGFLAESDALAAWNAWVDNEPSERAADSPGFTLPPGVAGSLSLVRSWYHFPVIETAFQTTNALGQIQSCGIVRTLPRMAAPPRGPAAGDGMARVLRVPLGEQTHGGDCAPLVVSGLLRHYGVDVRPDALETLPCVHGTGGTDVQALLDELRIRLFPLVGLHVREYLGFEEKRFVRLFREYNRLAARKPGARRLFWADGHVRIARVLSRADPDILLAAANRQTRLRRRFWNAVRVEIDAGNPLLWGVTVGIVPEEGLPSRQTRGGHLRLIVGYDAGSGEIVFADPWGPGHDAKRLSLEAAWAETATLHAFERKERPRPQHPVW